MTDKFNLYLDFDCTRLHLVMRAVRRLQEKFGLGDARILQSSELELYDARALGSGIVPVAGYHAEFLKDSLSWEEVERAMDASGCHDGYRWFSKLLHDQTLRKSPHCKKPGSPFYLFTLKKDGGVVREP